MADFIDRHIEDPRLREVVRAMAIADSGSEIDSIQLAFESYGEREARLRLGQTITRAQVFLAAFDAAIAFPLPYGSPS